VRVVTDLLTGQFQHSGAFGGHGVHHRLALTVGCKYLLVVHQQGSKRLCHVQRLAEDLEGAELQLGGMFLHIGPHDCGAQHELNVEEFVV